MDVSEFVRQAREFKEHLDIAKARVRSVPWYPYDSLTIDPPLEKLLRESDCPLLDPVRSSPVADIGCADGDMAFFLDSLGYTVDALDNPITNYNRMEGVYTLKTAMDSAVSIYTVDLDTQFRLPRERYGLVLLLGILYHLKNPYYVLEQLARHTMYCLISTRVARYTPDYKVRLELLPVAYLLDDRELNSDETNYWIFSKYGLLRILKRSGWNISYYISTGDHVDSDPVDRDERVYCLLESRLNEQPRFGNDVSFVSGWHAAEQSWRWTERRFSALLNIIPERKTGILRLGIALPDVLLARLGSITINVKVNGSVLLPQTFTTCGSYIYARRIPMQCQGGTLTVECELDKALPPSELDKRELGVIVYSMSID